jgi:N-acetylglucosamine-6-phosphate deacetylase
MAEVSLAVSAGVLVTPLREHSPGVVLIRGEHILAVGDASEIAIPEGVQRIDASRGLVGPGFVDTHVHGREGHYFGESEEITLQLCRSILSSGTTSLLPTVGAQPTLEGLLQQMEAIHLAMQRKHLGAQILGLHAEGPYFSDQPVARGSQPAAMFRKPSIEELHRMMRASGSSLRLMSLAPELDGALELINELVKLGVVVSAGHSAATFEQAMAGVRAGLSCATHTFNGMLPFHHRKPGLLGAVLTSHEIRAELIADGEHVSPPAMRLLVQMKGVDGVHLVTDNTMYAGLPDGTYEDPKRDRAVRKEGNRAYVVGGTLAGSVAPMSTCVGNLVTEVGCSIVDAVRMATLNPAKLIHADDLRGSLEPGKLADLVALDDQFEVEWTMVRGRIGYSRGTLSQGNSGGSRTAH